MQQEPLFCEDITEALRATVQALGGPKKVGYELWPTLGIDGAASKMRDCLNADRRQHLDPNDLLALMSMARSHGVHTLAAYLMREAGYADPQPVEPEDQRAALQREFIESVRRLEVLNKQLQTMPAGRGRQ